MIRVEPADEIPRRLTGVVVDLRILVTLGLDEAEVGRGMRLPTCGEDLEDASSSSG